MNAGQILLTAMFLVLGLGGALVLILVGIDAAIDDVDPLDGTLLYDGSDWDQSSHVAVHRPPYDWAADATDQGWGGPL